jgi:hypothetical protein
MSIRKNSLEWITYNSVLDCDSYQLSMKNAGGFLSANDVSRRCFFETHFGEYIEQRIVSTP